MVVVFDELEKVAPVDAHGRPRSVFAQLGRFLRARDHVGIVDEDVRADGHTSSPLKALARTDWRRVATDASINTHSTSNASIASDAPPYISAITRHSLASGSAIRIAFTRSLLRAG